MRSHKPLTASRREPARLAEYMRMPPQQFFGEPCTTSPNSNAPCSCAMRAWNTTCSSRSPKLVAQIVEIAARNGVGDLVGFLDRIGGDGREILLQVPRTAGAGRAQRRHDVEEPVDIAGRGHGRRRTTEDGGQRLP